MKSVTSKAITLTFIQIQILAIPNQLSKPLKTIAISEFSWFTRIIMEVQIFNPQHRSQSAPVSKFFNGNANIIQRPKSQNSKIPKSSLKSKAENHVFSSNFGSVTQSSSDTLQLPSQKCSKQLETVDFTDPDSIIASLETYSTIVEQPVLPEQIISFINR